MQVQLRAARVEVPLQDHQFVFGADVLDGGLDGGHELASGRLRLFEFAQDAVGEQAALV